jgi:two-component system nitrate/nitrite response regulator NarL
VTANSGPRVAVVAGAGDVNHFDGGGLAASFRRSFGPDAALRVLLIDAAGRLRALLTEGTWPEEADAACAARRPACDGAGAVETKLSSSSNTVLIMQPMILADELLGIVEILAPEASVVTQRADLPAFVESIATHCVTQPRPSMPESGNQRGLEGVRVLIVDRHKLFSEVVRNVLENRGAEVLEPVEEADAALAVARTSHPDVVLIDLALNGTAMGLARDMRQECPGTRVLGLTTLRDPVGNGELLRAGFHGYLTKDVSLDGLVSSIRATLEGTLVVPQEPSRWTPPTRSAEERHTAMLASHLTPREREVLERLVEGMTGEDIARSLSASPNTVRTHIQSILAKLQVHSRLEAAAFAVKNGIVRIPGKDIRVS